MPIEQKSCLQHKQLKLEPQSTEKEMADARIIALLLPLSDDLLAC